MHLRFCRPRADQGHQLWQLTVHAAASVHGYQEGLQAALDVARSKPLIQCLRRKPCVNMHISWRIGDGGPLAV